jgi:hypothetical protein
MCENYPKLEFSREPIHENKKMFTFPKKGKVCQQTEFVRHILSCTRKHLRFLHFFRKYVVASLHFAEFQ